MSLPLTPVVGYIRADRPEEAARLRAELNSYAERAGLVVCAVAREAAGSTGATLPAFAGCLEMIRKETARGILLPAWAHLAPNGLLGTALLRATRRDSALVYVADQTDVPDWAVGAGALPHQVQADLFAATRGQP